MSFQPKVARGYHGGIGGRVRNENGSPRKCGKPIFRQDEPDRRRSADRPAPTLVYKHRGAPNLQFRHVTCQFRRSTRHRGHPSVVDNEIAEIRGIIAGENRSPKNHDRPIARSRTFRFLVVDALHGQWHDGRRCYPGCSWLFPWFSPWESCWCSPQGPEAMENSRRRTSGLSKSASRTIARFLGRKVSTRFIIRLSRLAIRGILGRRSVSVIKIVIVTPIELLEKIFFDNLSSRKET